jgi:regulator-associated protein of mTOR
MTALACHSKVPLFASGSPTQFITLLTPDGDTLQMIRYHEELSGQRIGPVRCLDFHPHKLLLAAGAVDKIISLYAPKKIVDV